MRQIQPTFYFEGEAANKLTFKSEDGSLLIIEALESHLFRVRHVPPSKLLSAHFDSTFTVFGPDKPQFPIKGIRRDEVSNLFSRPKVSTTIGTNVHTIFSALIKLVCHLTDGDLVLNWYHIIDGKVGNEPFQVDLPFRAYAYDRNAGVYHYIKTLPNQSFIGLGEHTGECVLNGRRFRLETMDAMGYDAETTDPLYKICPFYIGVEIDQKTSKQQHRAFGVYYDNLASGFIDFGTEIDAFWGSYRVYKADYGILDYYVISGISNDGKADARSGVEIVVERFADVVGKPAMIPKFALGYLASSMGYADAGNAQELLEGFIDKCNQHDFPCDLMHLSSGYTADLASGARNVFTWNKDRFPDPRGMIQKYSDAGIHIAANVKPWYLQGHQNYDYALVQESFVADFKSTTKKYKPRQTRLWSAGAGDTSTGSYFDFTSKGGKSTWINGIQSLLELGISGIWNDNNEFALPDDDDFYAMSCEGMVNDQKHTYSFTVGECGRPLQTLLMAAASHEAMVRSARNKRPFLITRSCAPGVQRFAVQTWSGDNFTDWKTIKYNNPIGLGCGLSLFPMGYGHDVGGFYGPQPSPEMLVRWVQNGIFQPRFCIHSWKEEGVTEPWMFPEVKKKTTFYLLNEWEIHSFILLCLKVTDIIRDAIKFRYRLIPYLYNLHYEAHLTGHPVIRPLIYHFPNDGNCVNQSFEFMLGPWLLVASIFEDHAISRKVYLPENAEGWCDVWTGNWYSGGHVADVDVPLKRHGALFARGGAMVPLGNVMQNVKKGVDDARRVWIFPPKGLHGTNEYEVIEDDGETVNGSVTRITFQMNYNEQSVEVGLKVGEHRYEIQYDSVLFVLPEADPRTLVQRDKPENKSFFENGKTRIRVII
ncbi:hypothetical protein HK098_003453 [Nowakowskiella sp. JEL0407]|nr:hypothetical protein HK098_003453 [Nowakowskiella sp. JEL0407]